MRQPSDLGFDNNGFVLPTLSEVDHIVQTKTKRPGMLFDIPATNLQEQREELRRTLPERCDMAASLINSHTDPAIAWCHLNDESKTITDLIPDSVQVTGSDKDEYKEKVFKEFAKGNIRVLVTKPRIAGFGLNWQHCAHQTFFPSHSYEQYYQAIRRCWRFGQKKKVTVDLIYTEGQSLVLSNLKRKAKAASKMFEKLVTLMSNELKIEKEKLYTKKEKVPSWLLKTK